MGNLCLARYFEGTWRSSSSVARLFPLVMGVACISWAVGDFVLTAESLGGGTPPTPSLADVFYVGFFPLCFLGFAFLIRRGNRSSLAHHLAGRADRRSGRRRPVCRLRRRRGHQGHAAPARCRPRRSLSYPLGDILLFTLCVGGLAVLPRGFRPFFAIACVALAANAIGDGFNLLQPASRMGYIANGAAWPISLTLLALAVWILPPKVELPATDKVGRFRPAGVRCRHQHHHPLRRQLRAHRKAGAGAGDDHPARGHGADGPHRQGGPCHEDRPVPVPDRQDLGPDRRR